MLEIYNLEIYHLETGSIDIAQGECVINHGKALLTTGYLVNCICIGGTFTKQDNISSFLIHDAPQDLSNLIDKLENVTKYFYDQFYQLDNIVIFKKSNKLDTNQMYEVDGIPLKYEGLVSYIEYYCRKHYSNVPQIIEYLCDNDYDFEYEYESDKKIYGLVRYNNLIHEVSTHGFGYGFNNFA